MDTTTSTSMTSFGSNFIVSMPTTATLNGNKVSIIKKLKIFGITVYRNINAVDVDEFFNKVKKDKLKIKIIDSIFEDYELSIKRAEIIGQVSLAEKLRDSVNVVKKETEMAICGVNEYISKKQFDDLKSKSVRGIETTPIKNFTRHIPDEAVKKVALLKEKNIFDDFVVVHFDPKKENSQLTKAEKKKKEDPIIFGILRDSDKMYFIADWIDEYCNLTLDEVVKITGSKTKTIIPNKK